MDQGMDQEICPAEQRHARSVVDVLQLAFSADPFTRWLFPDASTFNRWFPEFVWRYSGDAFVQGTADRTPEDTGAALWLEPGTRPDLTGMSDLLEGTVKAPVRDELWRIAERLTETTPARPYWHLTFIGVDPAVQDEGVGSALLEHGLARCDDAGRVAYLETAHPGTVSLFASHGFQLIDVINTDGPSLYAMAREPHGDMR